VIRMAHPPGFAPPRPIDVPLVIAAQGPKGLAVAHELADGIITIGAKGGFPWVAEIVLGTVLDESEDADDERVLAAAGAGGAVIYHAFYDLPGWGDLDTLPGGGAWRQRADATPERTRHLDVNANHLVGLNALDEGIVTGEVLAALGMATDAQGWRSRIAASEEAGVTEIVYQPAGPDIERELTAFAEMAGLAPAAAAAAS
jgi:5,10-methylenetetrahydromethanopterin reductase